MNARHEENYRLKPYVLDLDDATHLSFPIHGRGGFQDLMRSLQDSISPMGVIHIDLATLRRMESYSRAASGTGGFQGRLRALVDKIAHANGVALEKKPQGEMFA